MQVTLLHTNDIHGRVEGLARVATLVGRIRAETPHRVIYADAGDVEETTSRLSNLTKGVAMHRLLSAAGCEVAVVGNAAWLRYGPQVIPDHARAASYPLLLANLAPVEGVQSTALVDGVGFVGVTDPFRRFLDTEIDYGIRPTDEVEEVLRGAQELRARGAELVVCLSHLGYQRFAGDVETGTVDPELAERVQGAVDVIVGAHSHDLLPTGERIGSVTVAQAGSFAEHLGRIDVVDGAIRASVIPVGDDVPPHPRVLEAVAEAERSLDASLAELIAELDAPLDAQWIAEMLRQRMGAEVGLATSGAVLDRPLPPGPLRRGDLWEVCHSTANPAVTKLRGAQLLQMLERGNDPDFVRTTSRPLRGRPRGPLHVAGATDVDPTRTYVVAATDYELGSYGGLVEPDWNLGVRYDFPTIVREAVEERLAAADGGFGHRPGV
ncbi:MAG TPA: 5'-nucleotidase C-terminal domain-containing protein [Gaiellaceae bacterium]|nr:5'-nucleotidase C-terminal domain-containing protein [Gaiellaceae bacterium]